MKSIYEEINDKVPDIELEMINGPVTTTTNNLIRHLAFEVASREIAMVAIRNRIIDEINI